MGINEQTDHIADLQIGSTSNGNVRLYISSEKFSIPLDFFPDEAEDIALELQEAARAARKIKTTLSK